jgi:stage V sporulation protein G
LDQLKPGDSCYLENSKDEFLRIEISDLPNTVYPLLNLNTFQVSLQTNPGRMVEERVGPPLLLVTEVRITPVTTESRGKITLLAYASITFNNAFVVRDVRIIKNRDRIFVSMPSRRMRFPCSTCETKNEASAQYCKSCGTVCQPEKYELAHRHLDLAHPVNSATRQMIHNTVMEAYHKIKEPSTNYLDHLSG